MATTLESLRQKVGLQHQTLIRKLKITYTEAIAKLLKDKKDIVIKLEQHLNEQVERIDDLERLCTQQLTLNQQINIKNNSTEQPIEI